MSSGGLRENAGRKRVGVVVNTRIDDNLIEQIEQHIKGISRADKIRKCLQLGVEYNKRLSVDSDEVNSSTISRFYKIYIKLIELIGKSENHGIQILNSYLLDFFIGCEPSNNFEISNETHKKILEELKIFSWSIDEFDSRPNLITPSIIGSVIEKVVNRKETGSYYTPKDTTNYITKYSIVFALLSKCDLPELTDRFYEQYSSPSNLSAINSDVNPIKALSKAINSLSSVEKAVVFDKIFRFTIVDPTCGTGAFIIAAADIMVEIYNLTNMYLHISLNEYVINLFRNCLYGVDILDSAISLIILRCKLYLFNLGISQKTIDDIDFRFYCGDTLSSESNYNKGKFHWETTFSSIIDDGGFDCVIGNPPYVELKANYSDKTDYFTKKCGNLYALIFEKALSLLKDNGYMGMIVPISIVSTQRMESLRSLLFEVCEHVYIANFSDRPSCLFAGVHQKLSIIFLKKSKPTNGCKVYTSSYIHWAKNERDDIFSEIHYIRTTKAFINNCGIAKVGDEIKLNILKKIAACGHSLNMLMSTENSNNKIFLNQRMTFWAKCFTKPEPSNEYKTYLFDKKVNSKAVAALINSSLFYLIWETYSDCWHITQNDLCNIRVSDLFFDIQFQTKLAQLETVLENMLYKTRKYIYSKQTEYIYVHRLCLKEITAINDLIAEIFDFTTAEKDYIQNYNLKYRLSVATNRGEK